MELWREIPGYEGIYEASSLGNIRSCEGKITQNSRYPVRHWKQRVMKQKCIANNHGRIDPRIILWKDGKPKSFLVSRLVAMTWVGGYQEGLTVNHIDGNPMNNNKSNLEWLTHADNVRKAVETGLFAALQHPVTLRLGDNVFSFASKSDAGRFLNRNHGYISNCMKANRPIRDANGNVYELVT